MHRGTVPAPLSTLPSVGTLVGGVGGGGSVPAWSGLAAPGRCFGDNSGGEGVEVRGVDDGVAHLVLGLKDEKCLKWVLSFQRRSNYAGTTCECPPSALQLTAFIIQEAPNTHTHVFIPISKLEEIPLVITHLEHSPHLDSCCPPSPADGGRSHWNIWGTQGTTVRVEL